MTAKTFLNRASWAILVVLLIPAGAVQASQNSVPGDRTYPVKLFLEDALLLVMKPSNSVTSDLEMKFTKRRLLEVEQVADTPFAIKSLKSLNEQVTDTTTSIGKVKNLDKQAEQVAEYTQTLQETQVSLDQQQVAAANPVNSNPKTTNQVVNNYYYESNSGVDEAAQAELQRQLRETQAEITAELERLRLVALENERLQQQQQAEAAALEAEKQRQAAEKLAKEQQEAAQKAAEAAAAQAAQEQQAAAEAAAAQAAQEQQEAAAQAAQEAAEAAAAAESQRGRGNRDNNSSDRDNYHEGDD